MARAGLQLSVKQFMPVPLSVTCNLNLLLPHPVLKVTGKDPCWHMMLHLKKLFVFQDARHTLRKHETITLLIK